jgi:hypothetical protein
MILVSKYLVPKGYVGFTFFPFVFLKHKGLKKDECLINHENIHLRQQVEMLLLFFYLFYIMEFFIRLCQYKSWHAAYRNISFEREAYANEQDFTYLKSRSFWQFLKYIRNQNVPAR